MGGLVNKGMLLRPGSVLLDNLLSSLKIGLRLSVIDVELTQHGLEIDQKKSVGASIRDVPSGMRLTANQ